MTTLKKTGLSDLIVKHCEENKPLLGICLGMQLLFESSEEGDGTCQGLAFIPGKVEKIIPANQDEKIPHNGWNEVNITQTDDILWKNIDSNKDFYFNHSYAAKTQPQYVIGQTPFAGGIISAVRKHNAWGVQFHPEKSQSLGKILLQNFLNNHD
jgi:glutamine amidotransferase